MMPNHVFVTGTDTEVGKTCISVGLIALLQQQGLKTVGMKPIASGCDWREGEWRNDDALAMMAQSDVALPYTMVNPYAFEPAIAPHIAAKQAEVSICLNTIKKCYQQIKQQAEAVVVEGAGGWFVPINDDETMADLAHKLDLPVVLVVAVKLGCINHALLTVEAIQQKGLKLAGWVANHLDHQSESNEIIETLKQRIDAPCLGVVPCLENGQTADAFLQGDP
ncbi:dethiobiotin synthase [Methylophaga thiooxydans]|uniref:ATP-dependent dethiobiotin synthetase BioD n=1 Tax=Methylophaga thiooxydans DMS010 TaxID=637616 RepID=C0N6R2_9GAMM|nr:dethiobiotin synthase [Methylophaga thiooxydans]EEF79177.1 dethiobiotin synthase [Methylophaga thiooxydans DMS010]